MSTSLPAVIESAAVAYNVRIIGTAVAVGAAESVPVLGQVIAVASALSAAASVLSATSSVVDLIQAWTEGEAPTAAQIAAAVWGYHVMEDYPAVSSLLAIQADASIAVDKLNALGNDMSALSNLPGQVTDVGMGDWGRYLGVGGLDVWEADLVGGEGGSYVLQALGPVVRYQLPSHAYPRLALSPLWFGVGPAAAGIDWIRLMASAIASMGLRRMEGVPE